MVIDVAYLIENIGCRTQSCEHFNAKFDGLPAGELLS